MSDVCLLLRNPSLPLCVPQSPACQALCVRRSVVATHKGHSVPPTASSWSNEEMPHKAPNYMQALGGCKLGERKPCR